MRVRFGHDLGVPYAVVLFLHLAGAIATFVGVGSLFLAVVEMRGATRTSELRRLGRIYEIGSAVGLVGIVIVAASGLYLAATVWGLARDWVLVAIVAFALIAPIGPAIVGPRIERVMRKVSESPDGPLPPDANSRLADPILKVALLALLGDLVGIVFVMTIKPSVLGSIAAVVGFGIVAIVLGLPPVSRALASAVHALAALERNSPLYRR